MRLFLPQVALAWLSSLVPSPFPKPQLESATEAIQLFVPITLFLLRDTGVILSVISLPVCLTNGGGVLGDQLLLVMG